MAREEISKSRRSSGFFNVASLIGQIRKGSEVLCYKKGSVITWYWSGAGTPGHSGTSERSSPFSLDGVFNWVIVILVLEISVSSNASPHAGEHFSLQRKQHLKPGLCWLPSLFFLQMPSNQQLMFQVSWFNDICYDCACLSQVGLVVRYCRGFTSSRLNRQLQWHS